MATRDEPPDPQEVLAAAEAAHLAARRTVPISRSAPRSRGADPADRGPAPSGAPGGAPDPPRAEPVDTVRLDRPTVRLPRSGARGRPPGRARPGAPLPLAAAVAAGWAALVSFGPLALFVMLLHAAASGPPAVSGPVRVAAAGWLLGHGVPLTTPAGPVGLAPLALAAFAAWRLARAGVHVTRASGAHRSGSTRRALVAGAAVAVAYGAVGALAGAVAGGPEWGAPVLRAGLTVAGFGFVAATYGALRAAGAPAGWPGRVPPVLRDAGRAAAVAAAVVLAAGAALAGVAVAASGGAATDVLAAYRTDVAGQAGLTLLCLAYAPNLAVWAAAYLVGPGFAVGDGTVVRSSEVLTGPLPGLPVFAAVPEGPMPTVGAVLLVVPAVAGAVGGRLVARGVHGWGRVVLGAVACGALAGGSLGLLAAAAGGPLGGGQLAAFGPAPLPVALSTAAAVTAGAVLSAVATVALARRRGG